MRYGFIGLGNLGAHLAGSLLRDGFDLTVSDLRKESAAELLAKGAHWAESPAAMAQSVDAVITCLPSPAAVDAVVSGKNGILEGAREGLVWIDMSTSDRHDVERLVKLAGAKGVAMLEAPVTGGVHRAAAGQITVLVGGETALVERHRPAFESMGGKVLHMGPLGSASVIKVITNMLAFIHLVACGEALMLAKRGGLDLAQSWEAIRASSGNSFVHETEGQLILNGSYDVAFTMALACKDLGFAHDMGKEFGVPLAVAGLVEQIFRQGYQVYGSEAQSTQIVKLLEDALGTDLRAPGFPARLEPA